MQPLFDRRFLYEQLAELGHQHWVQQLEQQCSSRLATDVHGNLPGWTTAWEQLPAGLPQARQVERGHVVAQGGGIDAESLRALLMKFHPWRKGPFQVGDLQIDTEWRSDLKWNRLSPSIDFEGKRVLDVGSGNGYYGWRMLAEGARLVLGCEPFLLYVMQFEAIRRLMGGDDRHFVLPLMDTDLPDDLALFDLTFSMGVLYHRTSPIDHLRKLASTLRPSGQLVLETLVIEDEARDGEIDSVLVPAGRYAKMRNVWFLPTIKLLTRWLQRSGFDGVEMIDVSRTTVDEQRPTDWMTFESLPDFLDPNDSTRTIEGYPSPIRAMLIAQKR